MRKPRPLYQPLPDEDYPRLHEDRLRQLTTQAKAYNCESGSERDLDIRAHRTILGLPLDGSWLTPPDEGESLLSPPEEG